uniref:Uncharacterized protein n=1 Tax=Peromyscus maniculatus bairdii TaxID=230844 RepID=A0A8C8W4N8_PERMB
IFLSKTIHTLDLKSSRHFIFSFREEDRAWLSPTDCSQTSRLEQSFGFCLPSSQDYKEHNQMSSIVFNRLL